MSGISHAKFAANISQISQISSGFAAFAGGVFCIELDLGEEDSLLQT